MALQIRDIVFDCEDPPKLARWWAQIVDGYDVRPYDDEEIARLASLGYTPETDPGVAVDGPSHTLFFQKVPEGKTVKNRLHLDLIGGDRDEEVAKLIELGATLVAKRETWTTLLDPEDNEFCVMDG